MDRLIPVTTSPSMLLSGKNVGISTTESTRHRAAKFENPLDYLPYEEIVANRKSFRALLEDAGVATKYYWR